MIKLYDDFRSRTAQDKVMCLNCGAINPAGQTNCENCEQTLERPASFLVNVFETVVRPMRAMPRIAATLPVIQAFLIVLATTFLNLLVQIIGGLRTLEYYFDNPSKLSDDQRKAILEAKAPPSIGWEYIAFNSLFLIVTWFFFALSVFYIARLLYRNDARTNLASLLSVVGFARIAGLGTFIFLLPIPSVDIVGLILSYVILLWQVALMVIGTKFSTGLTWNRATLIVAIPTLLFRFVLQLPF